MMASTTEHLRADPAQTRIDPVRLATAGACGFALAYPLCLWLMFQSNTWILGTNGRPGVSDFLVFWLAGKSALRGAAAAAYDPRLHHAAEVAISGHEFARHMSWHYPPLFLFVAAGLALIPLVASFIFWVASTAALYSATIFRIAKNPLALLLSCAAPAMFINAIGGQNGALTAALFGAALLFLEDRPILSGIFLGLLTYRPQLGILIPIALIAGGYWRALIFAAIASVAAVLACWGAFGTGTMQACLHFMPLATRALLVDGENGFYNFQTIYGLIRWIGAGNAAGELIQGATSLSAAVAIGWLWRRDIAFPLKAAALSAASLLASPYLYPYDFAVLTVCFAFMYRHRTFDTVEIVGVAVANILVGAFLFFPTPICLLALLVTFGLIIRRIAATEPKQVSHADLSGSLVHSAGS